MQRIGVIGAGVMGRGIAQVSAAAGFDVKVYDISADRAASGVEFAASMLRRAAEKGQLSDAAAQQAIGRMSACSALEALSDSSLVIEAAAEDLEIKRKLFRDVESVVDEATMLATNTSSLVVTEIAS